MYCPVCKKPMLVLELQQIEIDYCQSCAGIWLDSGELELLMDGSKESNPILESLSLETNSDEKKHRCPVCTKKMNKVSVGSEPKIIIDSCRKNHGLWFDEGELQQIIQLGSSDKENKVLELLHKMFAYKLKNKN